MNRKFNKIDLLVGAQARRLRELSNVSKETAARTLGVTLEELEALEDGARRFDARQLQKLAERLGVAPAMFFEGLFGARAERPAALVEAAE